MSNFNPHTAAKIAAALEEADRTATPGEWFQRGRHVSLVKDNTGMGATLPTNHIAAVGYPDDAHAIASLRNHARQAAELLKAAVADHEASERHIDQQARAMHDKLMPLFRARDAARAKVERLRAKVSDMRSEAVRAGEAHRAEVAALKAKLASVGSHDAYSLAAVARLTEENERLRFLSARTLQDDEQTSADGHARQRNLCAMGVADAGGGYARCSLSARLAEVEAERERMRGVYEAAVEWHAAHDSDAPEMIAARSVLYDAIEAALAPKETL